MNKQTMGTWALFLLLICLSARLQADLPDLTVQAIMLDQDCLIVVTMKNQGGAVTLDDFENAIVYVTTGGSTSNPTLTAFDPEQKLRPAGGVLVKQLSEVPFTTGSVRVKLDGANAITESNESNNEKWANLTCASYAPDYGPPLIMINGFRLLDGCGIEVELKNAGTKQVDPVIYSESSNDRVFLFVSWGNVVRVLHNLIKVDPNRTLLNPGTRLKYIFSNADLGNKVFRGTQVSIVVSQVLSSSHHDYISTMEKELWCLPDLTVSGITYKPTTPHVGERIGIKVAVTNQSQVSSSPCQLLFQVGGESQPEVFQIPAMAPGLVRYFDRQFSPNREDTYRIRALMDSLGQVEEITEENNEKSIQLKVLPGHSDLQVTEIKTTPDCRVMVTVVNNGPGSVPDQVWTENLLDNTDVFLHVNNTSWGGAQIRVIDPQRKLQPPGGSVTFTFNLKVSSNMVIKAVVDRRKRVMETKEYNNELTQSLNCIPKQKSFPRIK